MFWNRGKGLYNIIQYKHTIIYTLYVYIYIYTVDRRCQLVLFASIRFVPFNVNSSQVEGAYERIFPDLNFQVRRDTDREWRDWTAMLAAAVCRLGRAGYVRKARLNHLYFDGFIALKVHLRSFEIGWGWLLFTNTTSLTGYLKIGHEDFFVYGHLRRGLNSRPRESQSLVHVERKHHPSIEVPHVIRDFSGNV